MKKQAQMLHHGTIIRCTGLLNCAVSKNYMQIQSILDSGADACMNKVTVCQHRGAIKMYLALSSFNV